jgi:hypothetical protein
VTLSFAKKARDLVPTKSLKFMLHSHLSGPEPARPITNIHASSLTKPEGFCPRYYALHDVLKAKPKDEWLDAASVITFDMGNDLQDNIVHKFADMGRAIGHWKCLSCEKVQEFCHRPSACPHCYCKAFKPEEVRFISDKTGASCGVDMLLKVGAEKLLPVELKTMGKDQFKDLLAPLAEHRLRTNLYLRIIAESVQPWASLVGTQVAKVFYVCKGGYVADPELKKWGLTDSYSPFKEFEVKRSDDATNDVSRRSRAVKQFRAGEVGMPCGICSTALAKRAQYCSMKKPCFSGDHPPVYDWQGGQT